MALTEAERMRVLALLKTLERSRDEREALYHLRNLIDDRLLCIVREREAAARGRAAGTISVGGHNYAADFHGTDYGTDYSTDWLTLERPPPVPPRAEGVVQESAGLQAGGRSNEQAEWDNVFARAVRAWRGF